MRHVSFISRATRAGRILSVFGLLLALGPGSGWGQTFGRWWWTGHLGLNGIYRANKQAGGAVGDYQRTGLLAGGDLNGFIVHPAIAEFRVGLDALLNLYDGGQYDNENQLGGDLEFRVLQQSRYPGKIFVSQRSFDYTPSDSDLSVFELEVPKSFSRFSGSWALLKLPIGSLRLDADRVTTDFFQPDTDEGLSERQSLNWSFSKNSFRHTLTLRQWNYRAGSTDLDRDGYVAVLSENGRIGEPWLWRFRGQAADYKSSYSTGDFAQSQYQAQGALIGNLREKDTLRLRMSGELFDTNTTGRRDFYEAELSYLWGLRPSLSLGPFVRYSSTKSDLVSRSRPALGIRTTWLDRWHSWDSTLTAAINFGQGQLRGVEIAENDQTDLGFSLQETISRSGAWTQEYELRVARDEEALESRTGDPLPGFGPSRLVGKSDELFARARVSTPYSGGTVSFWGNGSLTRLSGELIGSDLSRLRFLANGEITWARLSFQLTSGLSAFERKSQPSSEAGYLTAQARWKVSRGLALRGSYRASRQFPQFGPHIDGSTAALGLIYTVGQMRIELDAWDRRSELFLQSNGTLSTRSNTSVNLRIVRRLGGWLPIVSAPRRRGVVR